MTIKTTIKCKTPFVLLTIAFITFTVHSQDNLAAKLGFPADTKMLIIHADDLGVAHSENQASFEAIENGSVNSASLMMPTPWVLEAVNYAKANSESHDFGLHLVLTSEWKYYRWGPVSSKDKVPSLVDKHGYFHHDCSAEVDISEVEKELRAQIERAYAMGFEPTHLDSHMGCLFQSPELISVYLKMGQEYQLPVLANRQFPQELLDNYGVKVVLEEIMTINPSQYAAGVEDFYTGAIKSLKPGLSTLLIHTAYDEQEMQGMTEDHPDWGSAWRQADMEFFTSDRCKKLLEEEEVRLVTWRQIKEAFYSKP